MQPLNNCFWHRKSIFDLISPPLSDEEEEEGVK